VLVEYDGDGSPIGVSFLLATQFGERGYRLPANIEGVWRTMTQQHAQGKIARRYASKDQARRVGWRILKDWIEAQVAIIEAGMVTVDQVLLPYMQDASGVSLYEAMVQRRLALPAARGGET